MSKAPVKMRINVAGYTGNAVSVFAVYDPSIDILLVDRESAYEAGEREGYLKITNQPRDTHSDALFDADQIRDAIAAFFEMQGLGLLKLSTKAQRCNPANKIEREGMNDLGVNYRLAPDMSCGQVAVLGAALYASRQRGVASALDFAKQMAVLTI